MRIISDEMIEKAVNWWAEYAKCPKPHDNGDTSFGSVFAGILADTMTKPISDASVQTFKEKLTSDLIGKAEEGCSVIFLDCDYAPCKMLADAAREAGIPLENFPWKSSMHIAKDKVTVKNGYGSPFVEI